MQARFGGLDVLVNCAGMAQSDAFEEITPARFDEIMTLNCRTPFFLCQKALPLLRQSQAASILNIASVTAHKGYVRQAAYAASKHAMAGFTKTLAAEVYEQGIRVHLISPGGVFTDMAKGLPPGSDRRGDDHRGGYRRDRRLPRPAPHERGHRRDRGPPREQGALCLSPIMQKTPGSRSCRA